MTGQATAVRPPRRYLTQADRERGNVVRWSRYRRNKVLAFAAECAERGDIGAEHYEQIRAAIERAERQAS